MTETDLRFYELMVIISGELTEKEFEKELDEVRSMLTEAAAVIDYEESWGKRDFAFRLKRQNRGYYVIFDFHAEPHQIKELTSNIKLHPTVLRHIIVQMPDDYVPGSYKETMVHRRKPEDEEEAPRAGKVPISNENIDKESLNSVTKQSGKSEKNLDEIVDNPDIAL